MKLLIMTQAVDRADPILGFFHRWIEEFAKHCESVTVIGQRVGSHALPPNVRVFSLGKERGTSRIAQIMSFWRILWTQRRSYDAVLVHMTPVWVLLGVPLWLLLKKQVYLWYEVKRGGWILRGAAFVATRVFSATSHGLPRAVSSQSILGHGIDTAVFHPDPGVHQRGLIVAVGRVTRSKQLPVILRAFGNLDATYTLRIAGGTITPTDQHELAHLEHLMDELKIRDRVHIGWVSPADMPALLQRADVVLHACEGGLDKVVLEAMACGCPVVSSSTAAASVLPEQSRAIPETMADKAKAILSLGADERSALSVKLRHIVESNHSLPNLIARMMREMEVAR